jgi:1-acyl-sn-glycerol-3-phosphate acyltransferase
MEKGSEFFDVNSFLRRIKSGELKPRDAGFAALQTAAIFASTVGTFLKVRISKFTPKGREIHVGLRQMSEWCSGILRQMNVSCEVHGSVPTPTPGRGLLLISNHQTYFDIPVICHHIQTHIISAAIVKDWPILGPGGDMVGVVYVDRTDPNSRRNIQEKADEILAKGHTLLNFPEGANYKGPGMAPFKPGLFRVAAGKPIDIVPVVLNYPRSMNAEWVGDNPEALSAGKQKVDGGRISFIEHVIHMMSGPPLKVRAHFGEKIRCEDHAESEDLLQFVRDKMLSQINTFQNDPH